MYKGKIPATNTYCEINGGTDACVPCEDGTEKLGLGNSKDLCVHLPVISQNDWLQVIS